MVRNCLKIPGALQELPKEGLLDLMNRLLLVGGVLHAFDQVPDLFGSLAVFGGARFFLRGGGKMKFEGGKVGVKKNSGSFYWFFAGIKAIREKTRGKGPL